MWRSLKKKWCASIKDSTTCYVSLYALSVSARQIWFPTKLCCHATIWKKSSSNFRSISKNAQRNKTSKHRKGHCMLIQLRTVACTYKTVHCKPIIAAASQCPPQVHVQYGSWISPRGAQNFLRSLMAELVWRATIVCVTNSKYITGLCFTIETLQSCYFCCRRYIYCCGYVNMVCVRLSYLVVWSSYLCSMFFLLPVLTDKRPYIWRDIRLICGY